jgi:GR25 family glycosyltransferase involved in LPS biosynthesis
MNMLFRFIFCFLGLYAQVCCCFPSNDTIPFGLNTMIIADGSRSLSKSYSNSLPVYFINLSNDKIRRGYIKKLLQSAGFPYSKRIPAWIPRHVKERVIVNMTYPGTALRSVGTIQKEIGCIASHIFAMYTAVYDKEMSHIPYALIIEDDLRFEFKVDWFQMIKEFEPNNDWKILQLFTSNAPFAQTLWSQYKQAVEIQKKLEEEKVASKVAPNPSLQWQERYWNSSFWSTQAYLINKEAIKPLLSSLVHYHEQEKKYYLTLQPPANVPCIDRSSSVSAVSTHSIPSCMVPFRLVADIYLYSYFSPSYITRIPLINGAKHTREGVSDGPVLRKGDQNSGEGGGSGIQSAKKV